MWGKKRRKKREDAQEALSDAARSLVPRIARADRFTAQDLIAEATADIGSRPGRLVMTTLGTVLGIGSLIATIGFAQTASAQIASTFDAAAATHVVVAPETASRGSATIATGQLPWDSPTRVERLAGVESATLLGTVELGEETITAVPVNDPSAPVAVSPALVASSPEFLDAMEGTLATGRFFDTGHDERGDRVAVLGTKAAERLGINRVDTQPSIFVAGLSYAVIGILDQLDRRGDLNDAVLIPLGAARADFGLAGAEELQIRIAVGAGPQVAEQSVVALSPDDTESLKASAPSARSDLSQSVQSDVNVVFLILGFIVLLAGGLGIANVTLLNVMERIGEIGLRRALGATRRQISLQFMAESIVIGLLGGLIGAAVGVLGVILVAVVQGWTPVVDPLIAGAGALLGAVVGWASGWYPARKAARIEPVEALRGG